MNIRRDLLTLLVSAVLILSSGLNVHAEDTPVVGEEIKALLSERTAIGEWNGDSYRQYFDPSGTTYYAPRGKRSTRGRWRVSEDGAHYESWWSGAEDNWESYGIVRGPDGFAWVDAKGRLYPFEMVDGQELVWPD